MNRERYSKALTHSSLTSAKGVILVNPHGKLYHGLQSTLPVILKKKEKGFIEGMVFLGIKKTETTSLLRPQNDLVFNPDIVPSESQEEVELLIKSTSFELKIMLYFLLFQIVIDVAFSIDSIWNRNLAYIEMSRFYAEIGIYFFLFYNFK